MARVIFAPAARADLQDIHRYIAQDSPAAAYATVRRIRDATARLADFPQSGRVVPEYHRTDIRELIVAPYRVLYRHEAGAIAILAVIHGSRQLPGLP